MRTSLGRLTVILLVAGSHVSCKSHQSAPSISENELSKSAAASGKSTAADATGGSSRESDVQPKEVGERSDDATPTPKPATLRLVIQTERDPLGSEQATLDKFVSQLEDKGGLKVDKNPLSEEEETYLTNYRKQSAKPSALPELPHAWGGFETVLVLSMAAPRGEPGRHTTGGAKSRILYHPPSKVPTYSALYQSEDGTAIDGSALALWVIEDQKIRAEEEAAGSDGAKKKARAKDTAVNGQEASE